MSVLQKQNRPILVRVLTHNGPEYWAKELTTHCFRHSRELYYTSAFADLYLSILLTNQGRISTSVDAMHLYFGTKTEVAVLLPSKRLVWNAIANDLTQSDTFTTISNALKYKASEAGEFTVISHDETFKTLFALIGQKKMAQSIGEFHALHTFRGFSGCTLGVSPQRSTSALCFTNAVHSTFDDFLASKVKFLFSDSPLRIIAAARSCFSSLVAVGEDPIHLAFRLEYCWGGKVSNLSKRVRQLHCKFRVATTKRMTFWQPEHVLSDAVWPGTIPKDTRTLAQWSSFCTLPFEHDNGYLHYVNELAKICSAYPSDMERKNSSGERVIKIIRNGSKRHHFEALQNSSRLLACLGDKGVQLGVGTTRNEQLHREIKSWMGNIYQIHKERLLIGLRIFSFAKLLTHSSAAYTPTLTQQTQQRLLFTIAGKMRSSNFFSSPNSLSFTKCDSFSSGPKRTSLQIDRVNENLSSPQKRRKIKEISNLSWKKEEKKFKTNFVTGTNVFKKRRNKG